MEEYVLNAKSINYLETFINTLDAGADLIQYANFVENP